VPGVAVLSQGTRPGQGRRAASASRPRAPACSTASWRRFWQSP